MSEHYNLLLFTLFKMKEDKSHLTGFAFLLCAPPFPPKTVSALVLTQLYGSLCTRDTQCLYYQIPQNLFLIRAVKAVSI